MDAHITIPSEVNQLPKVRSFAYDFVKKLGASEKVARRSEFIVAELCSNAIEYGEGTGDVRIDMSGDNRSLTVSCFNSAKNTPVSQMLKEKFHADFDPKQTRGRGLFVIRNWVKEANFEDTDGGIRISVVQSITA